MFHRCNEPIHGTVIPLLGVLRSEPRNLVCFGTEEVLDYY